MQQVQRSNYANLRKNESLKAKFNEFTSTLRMVNKQANEDLAAEAERLKAKAQKEMNENMQ